MGWLCVSFILASSAALCPLTGCVSHGLHVSSIQFAEKFKGYSYCNVLSVKQANHISCGLACLVSVGNAWGLNLSESGLAQTISGFDHKNGLTVNELKMVAAKKGLTCFTLLLTHFPMELTEHIKLGRPVICAIEIPKYRFGWVNIVLLTSVRQSIASWLVTYSNHYVVVCGFNEAKRRFLIMDPAHGYVTMGYDEFRKYWKEKTYAALLCSK